MQIEPRIAIIGASGFVGANLLNNLVKKNISVHGFARSQSPWRIKAFHLENYHSHIGDSLNQTLRAYNPNVVINAATHGAYSFQHDESLINASNLEVIKEIVNLAKEISFQIIHLGTSSEYGVNSNRPLEIGKWFANLFNIWDTFQEQKMGSLFLRKISSSDYTNFPTKTILK
jgi:dolichol-phosphate mannosyltransferase